MVSGAPRVLERGAGKSMVLGWWCGESVGGRQHSAQPGEGPTATGTHLTQVLWATNCSSTTVGLSQHGFVGQARGQGSAAQSALQLDGQRGRVLLLDRLAQREWTGLPHTPMGRQGSAGPSSLAPHGFPSSVVQLPQVSSGLFVVTQLTYAHSAFSNNC